MTHRGSDLQKTKKCVFVQFSDPPVHCIILSGFPTEPYTVLIYTHLSLTHMLQSDLSVFDIFLEFSRTVLPSFLV